MPVGKTTSCALLGADRGGHRGEREPDIFIEGLLAK